jgi:acetylglutamate kinase
MCAICWKADALIYLTEYGGAVDGAGSVIHWLDIEEIGLLPRVFLSNRGVVSILKHCRQALKQGVKRVRILPTSSLCLCSTLPKSNTVQKW